MVVNTALNLHRDYRDWKDRKRSGPEAQVAHRKEMKNEIAERLPPRKGTWPEAIVRDVSRLDAYPEADDSPWGISPWFKVEVKGQYHRGLEVLLKLESVAFEGKVARATKGMDDKADATVGIVGRIPYDSIVSIDWDGDEYGSLPHIYCWFDQAEGPYESIEVYATPRNGDPDGYWEHLDGLKFKPREYSKFNRWRLNRQMKKAQREFDREYG